MVDQQKGCGCGVHVPHLCFMLDTSKGYTEIDGPILFSDPNNDVLVDISGCIFDASATINSTNNRGFTSVSLEAILGIRRGAASD